MAARLFTILAAYVAAAIAGMVVLMVTGWIDAQSLSLDRAGYIAPLFVDGAAEGALLSLPIALPTILFTEFRRVSSPWIFAAAGVLTAAVIILSFSEFSLDPARWRPFMTVDIMRIIAVTTGASLSYWLVAWQLFPPARRAQPTLAADEFR